MCPAWAKKAGTECKKWAKVVPTCVDAVRIGTGMGFWRWIERLIAESFCTSNRTNTHK
jgi:hypothetical protein